MRRTPRTPRMRTVVGRTVSESATAEEEEEQVWEFANQV